MKRWIMVTLFGAVVVLAPIATGFLAVNYLRSNYPGKQRFPVRGIDVSHHQGGIDWEKVSLAGVSFAYIKATEGADHRDRHFRENWDGAGDHRVARGPYHFFTFCTPGTEQAANFVDAVPPHSSGLPPAVDVEFTGNCTNWTSVAEIRQELQVFLDRVEAGFGRRPVLYVTAQSYSRLVDGHFTQYPLWVRNILRKPTLDPPDRWTLWQCADRGRIDGVDGPVDLNVFSGGPTAFAAFSSPQ